MKQMVLVASAIAVAVAVALLATLALEQDFRECPEGELRRTPLKAKFAEFIFHALWE
jgi:hypothetical protein